MIRMRDLIGWVLVGSVVGMTWAGGLGEAASPLIIAEWLKGGPVKLEDGKDKNVYVLVFWATICPHSRASLPILSEMQKKFRDKGAVIVAVSPEPAETIKDFLVGHDEQMDFVVAADRGEASTRLYFRGVHNSEWPHAFVIDKTGKLVWHGHPMSGLEQTVSGVLDGTYDIETGRRQDNARNLKSLYLQLMKSPGKQAQAEQIGPKIVEDGKDDVLMMNDLAWKIATEPGLLKRDLELAIKAAQAAYEGCQGKNPEVLDTYARVMFESGKKEDAVKYQRDAVNLATDEESKLEFQKTLEKYEAAAKAE